MNSETAKPTLREFFADRGFYTKLWQIALPITIQNLLSTSLHLIDTAMVMRLGDHPAAAVGMAGRWFMLLNMVMIGVSSGASILISQYWGIKHRENIRKTFGLGLINCMGIAVVGFLLMLLMPGGMMRVFAGGQGDAPALIALGTDYIRIACFGCFGIAFNIMATTTLRSTEQVKLPLLTGFTAVIVNTVLNYGLIYGKLGLPEMGVSGAALATVISHYVQVILLVSISAAQKNIIAGKMRELFHVGWDFVKKFYQTTMWVILNETAWGIGTNLYSVVLGRLGATSYAAYSLFSSIEGSVFSLFVGCGSACVVMVGSSVGAGKFRRARLDAGRFLVLAMALGTIFGIGIALVRDWLIGIMGPETIATAQTASRLLLIYACILPIKFVPYILVVGVFRSGGTPRTSALLDLLPLFLIGVPVVFLLGMVLNQPIEIVYLGMLTEEIVKTIIGLVIFFRNKWIKRLTTDVVSDEALGVEIST